MTTIPIDPALVTAFALALVRASAWLFISPPFNNRMIPIPVKMGVAAALALAAAPHVVDPALPMDTGSFIVTLITQAMIGFVMGFFTLILVQVVTAAGSLIDLFAGYSLAAIYDPFSEAQTSIFGRFYQLVAATLLFTTNAHLILVNGFFRSFEAVPVGGLPSGDIASVLTDNVGQFLVAALEVAGPVIACLFLTEVTLGLLTRAAPNLNVFALAFPLRVVVALGIVAIALPLVAPALENLVNEAVAPFGG
ncbi:MAG: flagellar biosynthetic protein FliR [Actinomycetota bacterium]|nr:flagellar biosynthetic protein FliR [Actinomycetota bacterium]